MVLTRIMVCEIILGVSFAYWMYFVLTEKLHIHLIRQKKVPCKIVVPNRSREVFR